MTTFNYTNILTQAVDELSESQSVKVLSPFLYNLKTFDITKNQIFLLLIVLVDKDLKNIQNGVLGDIAPTILDLMGIEKPAVMTCHSLL
jgi:predicted AlkP superfamily phosphohydrolase/phosphomutase